jgi:pyruvate formate-lyase activating enzyme-like uncharacterized protein
MSKKPPYPYRVNPAPTQRKPKVWIRYSAVFKTLEVEGETYPIREQLKSMGFRWQEGRWVKSEASPEEALRVASELQKVAEVSISPLKDAVESLRKVSELIAVVADRFYGTTETGLFNELTSVQTQINEIARKLKELQERVDKKLLGA